MCEVISMKPSAVLLFPPNWSACVSGPHLALPLLAGMARATKWLVRTWDLSDEFYRTWVNPPRVLPWSQPRLNKIMKRWIDCTFPGKIKFALSAARTMMPE